MVFVEQTKNKTHSHPRRFPGDNDTGCYHVQPLSEYRYSQKPGLSLVDRTPGTCKNNRIAWLGPANRQCIYLTCFILPDLQFSEKERHRQTNSQLKLPR